MKRNLLILVIILLIGFIVNTCSDENECSFCKNGQHCYIHCIIVNCPVHDCKNHNKSACDVCNPKCKNDHAYLAIDDPCGGTPYEYAILSTVPVFRTIAVTHSQADGALSKITGAYTSATPVPGDVSNFNNKATEVHIVLDSIVSFDTETKVLKIGIDTPELEIMFAMAGIING